MICESCTGHIEYHDYIMVEEMNFDEANIQLMFCSYQCVRHYFGWRNQ